jgi:uncharacterized membrane protein
VSWLDAGMHALHLLGAISWIGGMLFTSLAVAPVLRRELPGPERLRIVTAVGRRFRMIEGIAFLFLFASGIHKVVQLGRDFDWTGTFGRILGVKLLIVVVLILLSGLHGAVWGPSLVRARERGGEDAERLARRVVLWARVELALALVVVGCGA